MKNKEFLVGIAILVVLVLFFTHFNLPFSVSKVSKGDSSGLTNGAIPFSVVTCTPSFPYDVCLGYSYKYGDATSLAKLNTFEFVQCQESSNGNCIKRVWWGGKLVSGDKFYFTDTCYTSWDSFWDAANCSDSGCSLTTVSNTFETTLLTTGQSYNKCPTLVAWDNATTTDYGAWSYVAYGWNAGNRVNFSNLPECYADVDCDSGRICSSTGGGQCIAPQCLVGQEKCDGFNNFTCNSGRWSSSKIVTGKCGVECVNTSDCSNDLSDQLKCVNGEVFSTSFYNTCQSYKCGTVPEDTKIKDCLIGCGDATSCMEDNFVDFFNIYGIFIVGGLIVVGGAVFLLVKKRR